MKRKQRTEILIDGSKSVSEKLAQQIIDQYSVITIEEPNHGLVMIKSRETAKKSLFYLGELFITECKVSIQNHFGLGVVKGDEPELAYHLAVIDAAYAANLPETLTWTEILASEEERIQLSIRKWEEKVLKTKVNFETMDID
ncbi:phosphonate C-P lyase system protein PhnG [Ectobacillus polymachus]|uniref:phosphonate C-P lyase system protein PhnG n=1 Tax=Ectobacillus polymachus TaxID=1508806 RepID=UPI003A8A3DED